MPAPARAVASSAETPPAASTPAQPDASETDSRLAREVDLVDQARAALRRGDTGASLAALDSYEREVRGGRLGAEAMYLRMEALSRSGDHARAANAARRLLSAYPDGPHAARAKALVGITER
jgi:TolA-binding protein